MPFKTNDPNINRNGRPPKELAIADIIRTELLEIDQDTGKSKRELMIENVISLAIKPNPERWAVEWLANRTEGRPVQSTKDLTQNLEPILLFDEPSVEEAEEYYSQKLTEIRNNK